MKPSTYLSVIDGIRNSLTMQEVASRLGCTPQNISRYTRELKKFNVIRYKGNGVWDVREEKVQPFMKSVADRRATWVRQDAASSTEYPANTSRGHAWQFTIKIPKKLSKTQRRKCLDHFGIGWSETGAPTWKGEKFKVKGWTVWFTPKSVVCWYPKEKSIFSNDAREAFVEAAYRARTEVWQKAERVLGLSLRDSKSDEYEFKTDKEHYALIKNQDAQFITDDGIKLYIHDVDGKLRIMVDESHGVAEFEAVKQGKAQTDAEKLKANYASVVDTGMTYHDVLKGFQETRELINGIAENQEYYAENMVSHVAAIQELAAGVADFRSAAGVHKESFGAQEVIDQIGSWDDVKRLQPVILNLSQEDKDVVGKWVLDAHKRGAL